MPRHKKVAGFYVIPSEILSVSVRLSGPTLKVWGYFGHHYDVF